ncbi:MAG: hypothetical protein LBB91_09740 [Clostridiales bacterium]|jgi:hypothetical protein|nr:hypothetical protein [Clostridiales bacterium]
MRRVLLFIWVFVLIIGFSACTNDLDGGDLDIEERVPVYTDLFDKFFIPYAKQEYPVLWHDMRAALTKEGYEYLEDSGMFSLGDPDDPEAYLGGYIYADGDTVIITTLGYSTATTKKSVEVVFDSEEVGYFVNVTYNGRERVDDLDDLIIYLTAVVRPLTETELAYFNGDGFFNGEKFNICNQFLSSIYYNPNEMDLFELFYNGSGIEEKITEAELAQILTKEEFSVYLYEGAAPQDCIKISRVNIDAVLLKYAGITLAETGWNRMGEFIYLEEYEAYYHLHGDTNAKPRVAFSGGERDGRIIRLFYTDLDKDITLTLREKDDGYIFVSNMFSAENINQE